VLDKPLHKFLLDSSEGVAGAGERRVKVVSRDDPDGMKAVTLVKVIANTTKSPDAKADYSLLEVTIKTGRTHQIRVHLASEGMPIVGDDKYGNFELNKSLAKLPQGRTLKRMFLHAWSLEFNHPTSGERIALKAHLPQDLQTFLRSVIPPSASIPPLTGEDRSASSAI
jgi:23S rRNA pseudouridine955/2504/2580 synthase